MKNELKLDGKITLIGETVTFDSGFSKSEFVITTNDDKYPQDVKFELIKDNCGKLDDLNDGQSVEVFFNVRGNEYNGNHYVSLSAWRIDSLKASSNAGSQPESSNDDVDDDIPF